MKKTILAVALVVAAGAASAQTAATPLFGPLVVVMLADSLTKGAGSNSAQKTPAPKAGDQKAEASKTTARPTTSN